MCTVHIISKHVLVQDICENDIIFCWDNDAFAINEHSVPSWYEDNFLSLRQELIDFVYDLGLCTLRGKSLYKWFCANDRLSMWWCSLLFEKHPQLMPELYTLLKLRSVEQMLVSLAPHCKELILHFDDAKLAKSLKLFCLKSEMEFKQKKYARQFNIPKFKPLIYKTYTYIPAVLRAFLRFVHWFFAVRLLLPKTKQISPKKNAVTMVAYFPHEPNASRQGFSSNYWNELQDAVLKAEKNINWLFIRIRNPHISLSKAIAQLKAFNAQGNAGASFYFAEEFLTNSDIYKSFTRYVRIAYTAFRLEKNVRPLCHLGKSNINIWEYLKPYWRESFVGWTCLERALQRRAMLAYAEWAGEQEWVLYPLENCPWERMLTEAIKHKGLNPIYGMQHSILRSADFRYFDSPCFYEKFAELLPHKILLNGEYAQKIMLEAHLPQSKFHLVEALRYLHLSKYVTVKGAEKDAESTNEIILVTSFFKKNIHAQIELLAKFLALTAQNSWRISIKAHPYCSVFPALKKFLPAYENIYHYNISMDELLAYARKQGAMLWFSNDTSAMLEAAYLKLPFVVQAAGDNMNFCPLQGLDVLQYVSTSEHLIDALYARKTFEFDVDFFRLDADLSFLKMLLKI